PGDPREGVAASRALAAEEIFGKRLQAIVHIDANQPRIVSGKPEKACPHRDGYGLRGAPGVIVERLDRSVADRGTPQHEPDQEGEGGPSEGEGQAEKALQICPGTLPLFSRSFVPPRRCRAVDDNWPTAGEPGENGDRG